MKNVVSESRKAFAAAYRSDESRQICISASRHASSVIAKLKAAARHRTSLHLSPESDPKSVYSFSILW